MMARVEHQITLESLCCGRLIDGRTRSKLQSMQLVAAETIGFPDKLKGHRMPGISQSLRQRVHVMTGICFNCL